MTTPEQTTQRKSQQVSPAPCTADWSEFMMASPESGPIDGFALERLIDLQQSRHGRPGAGL